MKSISILSLIIACIGIVSCKGPEEQDYLLIGTPLQQACMRSSEDFYKAVHDGREVQAHDIPRKYWADELRAMKPLRVYTHRVNTVIVLEEMDGEEKGKYVCVPISSFFPVDGFDGFTFKILEDETYEYERKKQ